MIDPEGTNISPAPIWTAPLFFIILPALLRTLFKHMKSLYLLFVPLLMCIALKNSAQTITTIIGKLNPNPVVATSIGMNLQNAVIDAAGNIYIADPDRHVVRKQSASGMLTTIAGNGLYGFSGDGGQAKAAQLKNPYNVAIDAAGNVYITDSHDNRIRKVAVNGIITTVAGNGTAGFSGDGGPATSAQLNGPNAIAADGAGNIFIADFSNNRVRKVASNGVITTVAGNGEWGFSGDGGAATAAQFRYPIGVAADAAGNIFISDLTNNRIRKVTTGGIITTVAGNGSVGYSGDYVPAVSTSLNSVSGSVAVDAAGNIFIPDSYNNRIRKVDAYGTISTVAGNGGSGFSGDGSGAGEAQVANPTGVCVDAAGNLYISSNRRIRKVAPNSLITTVSGNGAGGLSGDGGQALYAQLYFPNDVIITAAGNMLIANPPDNCVRKVDANGIITTIAGNGSPGFSGDGGPASSAQLNFPTSVATDNAGNIYIADAFNLRIRKINPAGVITTVAGNGTRGYSGDGGPAGSATLRYVSSLATDAAGNLYIADRDNHCIRKLTTDGTITTIAGNGTAGYAGDGGAAVSSQLNSPEGILMDISGSLVIVDGGNARIRKIAADGTISTVAGTGTAGYSGDGGSALAAQIYAVGAPATDAAGNIFICGGGRIRKVTAAGTISTIAGGGTDTGEGVAAAAALVYAAVSVAVDAAGNLYITEFYDHRIRKVSVSALPLNLLAFTAKQRDDNVVCNWQTTHEAGTGNFFIQRSTDGINFMTIGKVTAAGSSTGAIQYTYTDHNIEHNAKTLYYRLQIADKDGKKTYSGIKRVDLTVELFSLSLLPNPAHQIVYLKGEGISRFIIADNTGRIVRQQIMNSNQTAIDVSGLMKGTYVVEISYASGVKRSRKLVIQ